MKTYWNPSCTHVMQSSTFRYPRAFIKIKIIQLLIPVGKCCQIFKKTSSIWFFAIAWLFSLVLPSPTTWSRSETCRRARRRAPTLMTPSTFSLSRAKMARPFSLRARWKLASKPESSTLQKIHGLLSFTSRAPAGSNGNSSSVNGLSCVFLAKTSRPVEKSAVSMGCWRPRLIGCPSLVPPSAPAPLACSWRWYKHHLKRNRRAWTSSLPEWPSRRSWSPAPPRRHRQAVHPRRLPATTASRDSIARFLRRPCILRSTPQPLPVLVTFRVLTGRTPLFRREKCRIEFLLCQKYMLYHLCVFFWCKIKRRIKQNIQVF